LLMTCWLTCLVTTSAFMPNYLVDYLKLPLDRMSSVMSAIGLGATLGTCCCHGCPTGWVASAW
jgi:hypothetical protein